MTAHGFGSCAARVMHGTHKSPFLLSCSPSRWSPHWHVIVGRNFGSFVTHETKKFIFFYLDDKAVMIFKNSL